jgi:hypothetical protein
MATPNIINLKNLAPQDLNLSLSQAVPAANANVTTGVLDMQAVAPNSDAWTDGVFAITFPAMPENQGTGITVAMQVAPPSLTTGAPAIAPNLPVPGAFITPADAQTVTLAGIAGTGTPLTKLYMTMAFDPNGSPYQFYQFLITTPVGTATVGEIITIAWEDRH